MRIAYMPLPAPVAEAAGWCAPCQGRGVTGEQGLMEVPGGAVQILVDVVCPVCDGCGRAVHLACTPMEHVGWDADGKPAEFWQQDRCPSCYGRQWNAVQLVDEEGYLRMPCGCAEPLMVDVPNVEETR